MGRSGCCVGILIIGVMTLIMLTPGSSAPLRTRPSANLFNTNPSSGQIHSSLNRPLYGYGHPLPEYVSYQNGHPTKNHASSSPSTAKWKKYAWIVPVAVTAVGMFPIAHGIFAHGLYNTLTELTKIITPISITTMPTTTMTTPSATTPTTTTMTTTSATTPTTTTMTTTSATTPVTTMITTSTTTPMTTMTTVTPRTTTTTTTTEGNRLFHRRRQPRIKSI